MLTFLVGFRYSFPILVLSRFSPGLIRGQTCHGMPFSRLVFVMLKSPPVMGFYSTPFPEALVPKGVSKVLYLWLLGSKATIRYNHLPGNK